jgi:hypothetical protein
MRKDVLHLAEKLSAASGLNVNAIYYWLMDVGRAHSKNPRLLNFTAVRGLVYLNSDRYGTYCGKYERPNNTTTDYAAADYWEGKILARQEAYMD